MTDNRFKCFQIDDFSLLHVYVGLLLWLNEICNGASGLFCLLYPQMYLLKYHQILYIILEDIYKFNFVIVLPLLGGDINSGPISFCFPLTNFQASQAISHRTSWMVWSILKHCQRTSMIIRLCTAQGPIFAKIF